MKDDYFFNRIPAETRRADILPGVVYKVTMYGETSRQRQTILMNGETLACLPATTLDRVHFTEALVW